MKHKAPGRCASTSGEESRAAIQTLLLEKHLLQCGSWDPRVPRVLLAPVPARLERGGRAEPAPPEWYHLQKFAIVLSTCQYALDFFCHL